MLAISKAWIAIGHTTINTIRWIFNWCNNIVASETFARFIHFILLHHTLTLLLMCWYFESLKAFSFYADTKSFFSSSEHHEVFGDVIHHIKFFLIHFLYKHVFKALVMSKVRSIEIFITNLALNHNLWTITLDVLE